MANFCMYCGRPLKEGETCHCREEGYDYSSQEETPEFADEYPEFAQEDDSYYSSQNEEEVQDEDEYYTSQNVEVPQEDEEYYNHQSEEDYQENDDYYVSQSGEESPEDEEYYYSQNEEESPEDEEYYYSQNEEESPEDEGYYYSQNEEESPEDEGYYYGQDEEESSEDVSGESDGEYYRGQPEENLQQEDEYYYNQEDEVYYDQETDYNDMRNEEELSEGEDIGQAEQEKFSSKNIERKEKEKKNRNKIGEEKNAKQGETRHREIEKEQKNAQGEAAGLFETMHMVSTKMGNALDKVYNFVTPTDKPGRIVNGVDGRKLLGLSKEDKVAQVEDCYERGLQIVPDLIQPCGQEIPIRQYDICATRSLLKGTWQEGRLQVTNKRVLFRLSGRNWIGKMQKSVEFALDDVTGIDIRNGNRLSFVALFLNVYYAALFSALGTLLTQYVNILAIILGIAGALGISILLRKHYYAKLAVFSFAFAPMNMWIQSDGSIKRIVGLLILLGFVLYFILASIRPNFSFKILTKSGGVSPIEEKRVDTVLTMLFNYFIARGMDVLPGKDAERAMDEVGTMIMDIQKFGDFGIQKWKMD